MSESLSDKTGAAVAVTRDDERHAYVITLSEDGTEAGRAFFLDRDHDGVAERVFFHTEVDEEFGGRGLATLLVKQAVDATRDEGKLIVPVCPLVRGYLTKNADAYEGAFRPNRGSDVEWVQEQRSAG